MRSTTSLVRPPPTLLPYAGTTSPPRALCGGLGVMTERSHSHSVLHRPEHHLEKWRSILTKGERDWSAAPTRHITEQKVLQHPDLGVFSYGEMSPSDNSILQLPVINTSISFVKVWAAWTWWKTTQREVMRNFRKLCFLLQLRINHFTVVQCFVG